MIATLSRLRTRIGRIGLEFDGSGVRCAQVSRAASGWKVLSSNSVRLSASDGRDQESDAPFATTDLLLAAAGFSGAEVATVLPMNACELRLLELPSGTTDELRTMVVGEMESGAQSDAVVDFWSVPNATGSRPEMSTICALSASRPLISDAANLIQAGGFTVSGVDSLPTACARAADMWCRSEATTSSTEAACLSVHVGWDSITLVLSTAGLPELARVPHLDGFNSWLTEFAKATSMDASDLHQIVQGLHDQLPLRSSERLQRRMTEFTGVWCQSLCLEILRTVTFSRRPGRRSVPMTVLLMGSGAIVPGLAAAMTHELNVETRCWSLPTLNDQPCGGEFAVPCALSAWEIGG